MADAYRVLAESERSRVIVAGPRMWRWKEPLWTALADTFIEFGPLLVVHGQCDPRKPAGKIVPWDDAWELASHQRAALLGADWLAVRWVLSCGGPSLQEPHPAKWHEHGDAAGPLRNQEMADLGAVRLVACCEPCRYERCARKPEHVTHGTQDMITRAEKAGIPVSRYYA